MGLLNWLSERGDVNGEVTRARPRSNPAREVDPYLLKEGMDIYRHRGKHRGHKTKRKGRDYVCQCGYSVDARAIARLRRGRS